MATALKTTSLPDAVYEALRESIVSLQDLPGTMLTETGVATVMVPAMTREVSLLSAARPPIAARCFSTISSAVCAATA